MFFRNLTFLRFPVPPAHAEVTEAGGLNLAGRTVLHETYLRECALKPVAPQELCSRGFVSPYGQSDDRLLVRIGACDWITLGSEDKVLPPAAVNRRVAEKLAEFEAKEACKPGQRTRKRLKDAVVADMLSTAFIKPSRVNALLDYQRGLMVVDTASRRIAESVCSEVRRALGSFPAIPLNAEVAPRSVLTGWLAGEPMPHRMSLGDCATLADAIDHGAVVQFKHQDLCDAEVAQHLGAGKQATRLRLQHDCGVSFTLGEDLVLRQMHYHDDLVDELESHEREDLQAELDARFVLMSGAVAAVFDTLEGALNLTRGEG